MVPVGMINSPFGSSFGGRWAYDLARWRGYTILVEAAAIDLFGRDGRKIDTFEAADVDTQYILSRARTSEWQDPTGRAEVILRDHRMPLIQ